MQLVPFHRSRTLATLAIVAALIAVFLCPAVGPAQSASAAASVEQTTASGATLQSLEEANPAISYSGSWRVERGGDSGGSSKYLNSKGRATLTFRGTGVAWVARTTPNSGIGQVQLDGKLVATVDRYSANSKYQQVVYSVSGLPLGSHTIAIVWTGKKAASSNGTNLMLDAFTVTTGLPRPGFVTVATLASGFSVSWAPVQGIAVSGYRVIRTNSSGERALVATTDAKTTLVRDEAAKVGSKYTYQVEPVLRAALEGDAGPSVAAAAPSGDRITNAVTGSDGCPPATKSVSTAAQLTRALDSATAGTVISLSAGTYVGQFKLRNVDASAKRIWICGPSSAILTTGSISTGSALMINEVAGVTVRGITLQNSLKGVTVISSSGVVLRDLTISRMGYEGVHFRTQTVDSYLIGSTISGTGKVTVKYGEGVYVGTSGGNICAQNDCKPDRTERIYVIDNTISETGAQSIEAKEGTLVGGISGNRLTQASWMDRASTGLVLVKGQHWQTANNTVSVTRGYGLATLFSENGGGNDNDYAGNRIVGPASHGIWVHPASWPTTGSRVLCSNFTASGVPLSNVACIP